MLLKDMDTCPQHDGVECGSRILTARYFYLPIRQLRVTALDSIERSM